MLWRDGVVGQQPMPGYLLAPVVGSNPAFTRIPLYVSGLKYPCSGGQLTPVFVG